MDINTYLEEFTKNGGTIAAFAEKAGMTPMYLQHIRAGRKTPGMKKIMGIIVASDGEISIASLHPEIAPKGKSGLTRLRLLHKSIGKAGASPAPKHKGNT